MKKFKVPVTPKNNIDETIHGIKISDPYRWLEDSNNPKVKRWVSQQNKFTQQVLKANISRNQIKKEAIKYLKIDWVGVPSPRGEYYFWQERKRLQNQPVTFIKKGLRGKKRTLINPNKLNKKGTTTVDYWIPSPKGKYLAYGLSEGGTELATMYIMDVKTGKNLKDVISYARYSDVAWLEDERSFYYTRHPKPGTVSKGEELYYQKIYFHKLGTDPKKDPLIFGQDLPKEDMLDIVISDDSRYVAIQDEKDWSKNDVFLYDHEKGRTQTIVKGLNAKYYPKIHRGKFYMMTNFKAPNYKIIAAAMNHLPKKLEDWKTIVPESKSIIEYFVCVSENLAVGFLENVASALRLYDLEGNLKKNIELSTLGSVGPIGADKDGDEFFYSFESFFIPGTIYRYDLKKRTQGLYQKVNCPVKPDDFTVNQVWYESKDKAKVPMFIFHKKEVKKNKNNPLILYGYGGFAVNETPYFYRNYIPFLNKGGLMAVANIRGGEEFGEKWHKEGILDKKQNGFNDFIAAAEYLTGNGYTNPNKLAIIGGSNGGLLVGACAIQRPELYKAVVCMVPLLDMVRFPKFLIAARWIYEYGNPDDPKDLPKILKWSPYHNVKEGVEYPAILFTTANKDFRVDPLHARKMVALLQSINKTNQILLRTEMEAGHGPGKPLSKIAGEQGDKLAFLYWQLGIH